MSFFSWGWGSPKSAGLPTGRRVGVDLRQDGRSGGGVRHLRGRGRGAGSPGWVLGELLGGSGAFWGVLEGSGGVFWGGAFFERLFCVGQQITTECPFGWEASHWRCVSSACRANSRRTGSSSWPSPPGQWAWLSCPGGGKLANGPGMGVVPFRTSLAKPLSGRFALVTNPKVGEHQMPRSLSSFRERPRMT